MYINKEPSFLKDSLFSCYLLLLWRDAPDLLCAELLFLPERLAAFPIFFLKSIFTYMSAATQRTDTSIGIHITLYMRPDSFVTVA